MRPKLASAATWSESFRQMSRADRNVSRTAAEESTYTGAGGKFVAGNPGRPKGIVDKRSLTGRQAAQALATKAWNVVHALLKADDDRTKLDAAKIVLAYAHGQPRATVAIEDLRERADEYAAGYGLNSAEVIALAAKLSSEATPS